MQPAAITIYCKQHLRLQQTCLSDWHIHLVGHYQLQQCWNKSNNLVYLKTTNRSFTNYIHKTRKTYQLKK